MRLIYIDPVLTDCRGHWLSHCRSIVQGCNSLGIESIVVATAALDQSLASELNGLPLFRVSPYAQISNDPLCGHLISFYFVKDETRKDLSRLEGIRSDDLLYFEASSPASLAGCVEWYRSLPLQRPKLIVSLIEQTGLIAADLNDLTKLHPINKNPEHWRYVGLTIGNDFGIRFVTIEDTYAAVYTELLGQLVVKLPHPFSFSKRSFNNPLPVNKVSFLGAQRPIKGFSMAREIFKILDEIEPNFEFFVHDSRGEMVSDLEFFRGLSRSDCRVKVDFSPKDSCDWTELIHGAGCVIAPYDPRFYSIASSGIASECLSAGVPIVSSPNTCVAHRLNECGLSSLVANSYTPKEFVERILWYFENKERVSAAMSAARDSWNQKNGAEQFVRACLSVAGLN